MKCCKLYLTIMIRFYIIIEGLTFAYIDYKNVQTIFEMPF